MASVSTSESVGSPSLRELLHQPPVEIENYEGRKFMCIAAVKQLLTCERISRWIKAHPLHRYSDTDTQDQDLVKLIVDNSPLLFAVLVVAELEHLTSALLSNGQSDNSLPEIDCSLLGLSHDEQRRLNKHCHTIAPVLKKKTHLHLSEDTVLPFTRKNWDGKHGAFGVIFRAEVAGGHLEDYDKSTVAEKFIRLGESCDEQLYLREVETLQQREHPNIVPLLASYTLETMESGYLVTTLHLIFPLAEMDLEDWMIRSQPPAWLRGLPKPGRRAYLYRSIYALVSGLSFLHREKNGTITAHHDLKPRNILVIGQELYIADFGRSHLRPLAKGSETEGTSGLGTYEYHPPEYYKENGSRAEVKHGRAFDVWSMGCIIIEIAVLIVYDWESKQVAEFRKQREENPKKERPALTELYPRDYSFHNNWAVVEDWIYQLQIKDGSQKLKSTLNMALQMMTQARDSRLYTWEAELDLDSIQQPDDDRVTRLEKGALCVQPPPPQGKILNGTQTPLHRAAQNGDLERLVQLFEVGWSLYIQDCNGLTALDVFNKSQALKICDALRERLAPKMSEKATNKEQGWKLLQAATRGQVDMVKDLLAKGVDAMFVDDEGHSALHKAAAYDQSSVAECLLLAKGKELLRQKNIVWGDTPLHVAAALGYAPIMKQLLSYSPDIEDQQKQGKTALWLAAEWGREEAVELLLDHGAQTFTQRDSRETPLHAAVTSRTAVKSKAIRILKRLLKADKAGGCLEHKNVSGDTPLWLALFHNHPQYAPILLDNGASLQVANNEGLTILHVAVERGLYDFLNDNIHQFCREDFESRNRWNDTPLMIAQRQEKHRIVELLTRRCDGA